MHDGKDDVIERIGKQEKALADKIKKTVYTGMKIELKAVKNLFDDEE